MDIFAPLAAQAPSHTRPRLLLYEVERWIDGLADLPGVPRAILRVIARAADAVTWCTTSAFPLTLTKISERIGFCRRSVAYALARLEETGVIRRYIGTLQRLPDGTFRREPTAYQLRLPADVVERMRQRRKVEHVAAEATPHASPWWARERASEAPLTITVRGMAPTPPEDRRPRLRPCTPTSEQAIEAQRKAFEDAGDWERWDISSVLEHGMREFHRPNADDGLAARCRTAWSILRTKTIDVVRAAYSYGLHRGDEIGLCVKEWARKVVLSSRRANTPREMARALLSFFKAKASHRGSEDAVKRNQERMERAQVLRGSEPLAFARARLLE